MKDVLTEMKRIDSIPSEIHIFADKNHVYLRSKRSIAAPFIVVTNKIYTSDIKRHRTINPIFFRDIAWIIIHLSVM